MGAMVCGDGSDKMDAACPILRTSIAVSLRPLRGVIISSLWHIELITVIKQ